MGKVHGAAGAVAVRRRRWSRCVGSALCGLFVLAQAAHAFTAEHYELRLRPDFEHRVLQGQARIRLTAGADPAAALELSAPALQISRARLDGKDVAVERTASGWRMRLNETQASAATHWLELDYSAPAGEGLVFGEGYVYTAYHTCQWMPCAGPELGRASVAIDLELPEDFRSVASGQRRAGASGPTQRWIEPEPYPLYTLGFSAGRFIDVVDAADPRLRYLGTEDDAGSLVLKFRDSARMLAFFENASGLPLPHPVYAQVLVPGGAAQEASSFSLIGKSMLDPILEDPQEDWVIAHELAHQWWGNLITCAEWKDFWLNEGITVFMTAAWKQERWGEAAYRRELELARQRWQRAKDLGADKPLSWPGAYSSLGVKRAIHYSKGALFMNALREDLGERAFWDGLRRYSRAGAGRGVSAADLQRAMEDSAGRSLQALFDAWVY